MRGNRHVDYLPSMRSASLLAKSSALASDQHGFYRVAPTRRRPSGVYISTLLAFYEVREVLSYIFRQGHRRRG